MSLLPYGVLVDCDTTSISQIAFCFEKLDSLGGTPVIKRLYGDFASGRHNGWQIIATDFGFDIVEAPSVVPGKNSVDATLMIDAMEMLFLVKPFGVCIVSSDAAFYHLAIRMEALGVHVIGFGLEHTPTPLVRACRMFFHLSDLTAAVKQRTMRRMEESMEALVEEDEYVDTNPKMKQSMPTVPPPPPPPSWGELDPFVADDRSYSDWE